MARWPTDTGLRRRFPMSSSPSIPPAGLLAGAATVDITPTGSVFLYGYPHVPRYSTGVHDALECAALYVSGQGSSALLLANDLIFLPNALVREVRRRICAATGVAEEAILVSANHT